MATFHFSLFAFHSFCATFAGMNAREIIIAPISGLCNRMRVVASACALAEGHSLPLTIAWQATPDCNAHFDELFLPLQADKVLLVRSRFFHTPATKRNLLLPFLLRKGRGFSECRCFCPHDEQHFLRLAQEHKRLYVDTCYALFPYPAALVRRLFVPLPSLQERIEALAEQLTGRSLGIHIRRTDNAMAIRHSSLEGFIAAIDQRIELGEADSLFLATDDEQVKAQLRARYGARLHTAPRPAARNTRQGMEDALVELWTLARTHSLVGSYYSSFSDTAAELSGRPLHIA